MPHFTFPITSDGCTLDVLIGLRAADMTALQATGQPIPPPIWARAVFDTGSDRTAVTPRVLGRLGIGRVGWAQTQTAGGMVLVDLYEVSLSVPNPTGATGPMLVRSTWVVTEFLHAPPQLDVLLGMDLAHECLFLLDGPGGRFTLGF